MSGPVVCGVDGSPEAATAARLAGRIAALLDRPLVLVHGAPEPWVSDRPYWSYRQRLQEQAAFDEAGYVRTVLAPVAITEPETVERVLEWGAPDDALREVARRLDAELVVIGSRGQSPVEDVLLPGNSTSTGLGRDSPVPVVLVPPGAGDADTGFPGGALACGIDGSELARAAARTVGRLAERLGVPLLLVGIDTGAEDAHRVEAEAAAAATGAAAGVEVLVERSRGPVAAELLAACARHDAGLIAVGSRGRGPLTAALLGSVTSTLLRTSDRPVLVVSPSAAGDRE